MNRVNIQINGWFNGEHDEPMGGTFPTFKLRQQQLPPVKGQEAMVMGFNGDLIVNGDLMVI